MKATTANLIDFLNKAGHIEIPVYQRSYSWSTKECHQLWEDIVSLAYNENVVTHFMGSIVYIEKGLNQISSVNSVYLIDGQQRLTTISLLLNAIIKKLESTGLKDDLTLRKVKNLIRANDSSIKLNLNRDDDKTYKAILDDKDEFPSNYSEKMVQNFEFFRDILNSSEISPMLILKSLSKLVIIDVALERNLDNPQLIFDSLNSTGVSISQVDQIRNYILLGLNREDQNDIYNEFWIPMEKAFAQAKESNLLERFFVNYLTIQNNGEVPDKDGIYTAFNKFFNKQIKIQSRIDLVKTIYSYSKYFLKLYLADIDNEFIKDAIRDLNTLDAKDAYPFLMEVMDDYENELINDEMFLEILNTVENYTLKKELDKVAHAQGKNSTFTNLSQNINKMLALKEFMPRIVKENKVQNFFLKNVK